MFRSTHQTKFVVKPPSSTTINLGSPVHSVDVPAVADASPIGLPAVRANEKQALMIPEKVATRMPLAKLNSAIVFFFSSSGISFSLVRPANAAIADAQQADRDTDQRHLAGDVRRSGRCLQTGISG